MRKIALLLAALLCLTSAASAHIVQPVPFAGIGSLEDITHNAAFAIYQTALPTRVQKNLVTDYGATCNGVADDTSAFLAFKAAFQGTTPVQLNLPGICTFAPAYGSEAAWTFDGVRDLVVQGTGSDRTLVGIKSTSGLLLGGKGQIQDNNNSVRTLDANAGDSCVTLKAPPAVTVSAIVNNATVPATFTGSITSTTLTVTAVASGTIAAGAYVTGVNSDITPFTQIAAYGTGGTTGVGGTGTYQVSISQSRGSQTMTSVPASFTASVDTSGVMTVTAIADGTITPNMFVYGASGAINKDVVRAYGTNGTTGVGGTGTYQLASPPVSAVTSRGFIGNGQPRVTLNSTSGLSTGDVVRFTGINTGGLLFETKGNQWIKVINGTQIDLFQRDFNGRYISGGTGGGDHTSLFPVGSKVLMTGWNNQAYWMSPYGYPSNPHWFEYKTVTSVNSTTHQVCFDTVLENSYKASWPQMNTGSQFEVDPGGPATLYVYPPTWEATYVFKDLTIDNPGQTYQQARSVTYNNVVMTGSACISPTQNETHTWINVSGPSCQVETDKIVKNWNVTNVTFNKTDIQSSSFTNINVNGITASGWFGSGKNLTMQNATLDSLSFGIAAYGSSNSSSCTNCAIATTLGRVGSIMRVDDPTRSWSMSSGLITIPNAYGNDPTQGPTETQYRGLTPGGYVVWLGSGGGGTSAQAGRVFKVTSVTQDVDNTYIQTSESGGFPTGAWTTNGLSVQPHPAPQLTVSGMTGADTATSLNGCPAATPFYSCANFAYTGNATGSSFNYFGPTIWGVLSTFTFTNTVPYTNTGALGWTASRDGNFQVLKTDNTTTTWGVATGSGGMVNMKLPSSAGGGTRTLTQSGATGTQSLDNLTAPPTDAWFGGGIQPNFTANTPSDSPVMTMTLRTNQNLPP